MIRVMIADDTRVVRDALLEFFSDQPTIQIVGAAEDADGAVALAQEHQPDVALLDVHMPGDGHRAAQEMISVSPETRIIALSAHDDRGSVVGMLRAGAISFLTKGSPAAQIVEAVERAARGDSTLSPDVVNEVVGELRQQLQTRARESLDRGRKRSRIDGALHPGALDVVYQPIFALDGRHRIGVEALARFQLEPHRAPDQWFAEAWEVGRGVDLEIAAARCALQALPDVPTDEFLALNVSPRTICSPRFAEVLPAGSHPRLVLELTEHALVTDVAGLANDLDAHRRAGMRLAVDDAGASYASLHRILDLTPDIIKLDVSLTRDVDTDPRRRALVAALIPFAHQIGATVVAEGIETETELETMREFGASWGQGYLLARPGTLEEALSVRAPTS